MEIPQFYKDYLESLSYDFNEQLYAWLESEPTARADTIETLACSPVQRAVNDEKDKTDKA